MPHWYDSSNRCNVFLTVTIAFAVMFSGAAAAADLSRAPFLRNLVAHHFVPRIAAFDRSAQQLVTSFESLCKAPDADTLKNARSRWTETMLDWESANAVPFGPLAQDIADEARLLSGEFETFAATRLADSSGNAASAGFLNLLMNGLEHLGMLKMEKPVERTNGKTFPRLPSEQTAAAWTAQWLYIRDVLIGGGDGPMDSLDAVLRAQDLSAESAHMRAASDRVTAAMNGIKATPAQAIAAAKAIVTLRTVSANEVAPAPGVSVQFGESDGD